MYRSKVVRDLFWSINSFCGTFKADTLELLPLCGKNNRSDVIKLWRQIVTSNSTKVWLDELGKNPAPLLEYVRSIRGVGRVETYHAALIQFFIAHRVACAIDLVQRDVRLRSSGSSDCRRMRLQLMLLATTKDILHVEPCLLLALDASSLLTEKCGDVASTKAITALGTFVMFDLQCNVEFRVRAVANKIAVAESPALWQWARKTFVPKVANAVHGTSTPPDPTGGADGTCALTDATHGVASIAGFPGLSLVTIFAFYC